MEILDIVILILHIPMGQIKQKLELEELSSLKFQNYKFGNLLSIKSIKNDSILLLYFIDEVFNLFIQLINDYK